MPIFAVHYTYTEATVPGRDRHRPQHRAWLAGQAEAGVVLTTGPYTDGSGALLLFRADDAEALEKLLAQDPFAQNGVIDAVRFAEWQPVFGAFAD
ncbi:YciI family protein [Nocardia sp. alder85J]|uniref:YciI family protein n=1 Tax=Nocardia sp. alder85J TaxID=2862949 RepID=UPI001CD4B067|nr:YciI family protein [Nocardia sp. alder85J]MCX4094298.1 YciI family protein [Nocardia sp. alder85J]